MHEREETAQHTDGATTDIRDPEHHPAPLQLSSRGHSSAHWSLPRSWSHNWDGPAHGDFIRGRNSQVGTAEPQAEQAIKTTLYLG